MAAPKQRNTDAEKSDITTSVFQLPKASAAVLAVGARVAGDDTA